MSTTNGLVGKSVKRVEDKRFSTGNGRFADDIVMPRQTYASFVRSPYAHARILNVDITAAKDMPGGNKDLYRGRCRCSKRRSLRMAGQF